MKLNVAEFEAQIEREMQRYRVPGFAQAIVQGEEVSYARGFGVTSVEEGGVPITPSTLFCSGSISKPLTGAAIMRLVEKGMLELDTPVAAYVPGLTFSQPEFAPFITLRGLLSHTSGLFGTGGNFGARDVTGLATFIREAVPLARFVAPPGKVFEYCNLGIDLAGYVAEVVAGKYFPEVVQDQVLDPIGMQRTTYDRTVAMTHPVALPHRTEAGGGIRVQHRMFDYAAANPSGQVMASTGDLANFALMILNKGEIEQRRVLSPASVQEMLRPQAHLHDLGGSRYGLTFWLLKHEGLTWVAHAGLLTPYLCELSLIPGPRIGVVFECNITNDFNPFAIRRAIFDQLLDLPPQPVTEARHPITVGAPLLSRYTGTYLSLAAGLATVYEADNRLWLEREGRVVPLHATTANLFTSEDGAVAVGFIPGQEGHVDYFMLDEHAYRRLADDARPSVSDSTLERYTGRYLFDDGDAVVISTHGGVLHASFTWLDGTFRCTPLSHNSLVCGGGLIEFQPDGRDGYVLAYAGFVMAKRTEDGTGGARSPSSS